MIFLNREGDFSKEVKSEERIDRSDLGRVFPAEELEEGEIPGCWTIECSDIISCHQYYLRAKIISSLFIHLFFLFKKEIFGFEWE